MKDFNSWSNVKIKTDKKYGRPKVKIGDVYWCKIGINIGNEQDGKNESFTRPVVVVKKYSSETVFVIPLTSQERSGSWFLDLNINGVNSKAVLSQGRTVDVKRFEKYIENISIKTVNNIIDKFYELLKNN